MLLYRDSMYIQDWILLMTIKRQHMASQLNAYEMASRSRPSSPRYKLPAPSRRLWLILSLSLVLLLLVSIDACGSVFRRANSLGRRCSPPVADSDKAGAGLKVAIVSFSEESRRGSRRRSFQGLMEMVRGNKKAYADKKGYHFVDASNMIDKRRPASWSKIIAVKALLPYYDWVFWNDAVSFCSDPKLCVTVCVTKSSYRSCFLSET